MASVNDALTLALGHHQSGRLPEARAIYQRVLEALPRHAGTLQLLGVLEHQCGRHLQAIDLIQRSLAIDPDQPDACFNLGCALSGLERWDEAAAAYERSLRLAPNQVQARINLGNILIKRGDKEQALHQFLQATQASPGLALPHLLAGNVLDDLGKAEDAVQHYERAIKLDPNYAQAHNNLGVALRNRDPGRAIEHYKRAVAIKPDHDGARKNLADVLVVRGSRRLAAGEYAPGIADYDAALALWPDAGLRVRRALALPVIPASVAEIEQQRSRLRGDIESLRQAGLSIADPAREVDATLFYLAYHGRDDRGLLEGLAEFYRGASPALAYTPPPPPKRDKLRAGFVSRHLHWHTISSFMSGWIGGLDRERFEVVVGQPPQPTDDVAQQISHAADRCVDLPGDLSGARRAIEELQLDVLIYPDIGMDPLTYFLAFSRLAPVQCAWWGHPSTTGIDTVDYFLSCRDLEPDDAQQQYTEKLVAMPTLAMYGPKPALPGYAKTRRDFGFGDRGHLYLCPQSLFKLHPDLDSRFGKILRADPAGRVVLFEGRQAYWTTAVQNRLRQSIPDVAGRVVFLPRQPFSAYLGLVGTSDVVLDTPHFTGGNTSLQSLALGTPIVTQPGPTMRGRITLACYRQMGMTDLVASDEDSYVELAVRLGTDPTFRDEMNRLIMARHGVLFENTQSVRELESFLEDVGGRR